MGRMLEISHGAADVPANGAVQVEIACSFEELKTTQAEWDVFVESVGGEIFLTYDWCRIWWKYYGSSRDLRIFLFRRGDDLVGLVPVFLERISLGPVRVKAAKMVGSDFTLAHFSLPVQSEHLPTVVRMLSEYLASTDCDLVCIGPIAGLYGDYDRLKEALAQSFGRGYRQGCLEDEVVTYWPLKESWDSYLAGLNKNRKYYVKRNMKALGEVFKDEPGSLRSEFATREEVGRRFVEFVQMHQDHWQSLGMPGHFKDWPDSLEFHRDLADAQQRHNRLRLMTCFWGDFCLGYEYAYKFGRMYYAFLNARSGSARVAGVNVGTSMFSEQVKQASTEAVRYIDANRCRYEYKLRLGGELFPLRSIYIYKKGLSTAGRVYLFRILSKVLDICYYKIWYCRVARKLPFRRRPLWRIWIRTNAFAG